MKERERVAVERAIRNFKRQKERTGISKEKKVEEKPAPQKKRQMG